MRRLMCMRTTSMHDTEVASKPQLTRSTGLWNDLLDMDR